MDQTTGQDRSGHDRADRQIAAAMAAEYESLSPRCRADVACLGPLLAPDFHEFGSSGGEFGYEGTARPTAPGRSSIIRARPRPADQGRPAAG
jgi:hypothetical protein